MKFHGEQRFSPACRRFPLPGEGDFFRRFDLSINRTQVMDAPVLVMHFNATRSSRSQIKLRNNDGEVGRRREPWGQLFAVRPCLENPRRERRKFVSPGVQFATSLAFGTLRDLLSRMRIGHSMSAKILSEKFLERIQLVFPEIAVVQKPFGRVLERLDGEAATANPPRLFLRHQACLFQYS
jgi:hypothetical protein